jgi:prophage maintenance system killer protein
LTAEAEKKVDSLVASINGTYFGVESYTTIGEKIVAYLYFLIKDHPFTDGNKRTATLTFSVLCELNSLVPDYHGLGLDSLAVFIEKIQEDDYRHVIHLLASLLFGPQ